MQGSQSDSQRDAVSLPGNAMPEGVTRIRGEDGSPQLINAKVAAHLASLPWFRKFYRRRVGYGIARGIRKRFDVRLRGVTNPTATAIPIIALNHWTDDDPAVLLAACLAVQSLVPLLRCSIHLMGEHTFQPGFLGGYVHKEPRWLSYLLFHTNIAPFLRFSGGISVAYARTRLLTAHLHEILAHHGNLALSKVFKDDPANYLPGATEGIRIRDALKFRYRDALYEQREFSIFQEPLEAELWARHQTRLRDFVTHVAALADQGRVMLIAPQGLITRTGMPNHVRSGLHQLVNAMRERAEIVPINITYDPMMPNRPEVHVTIGKPKQLPREMPRDEFVNMTRRAILGDAPITMSQLAAETLRAMAMRGESNVRVVALKEQLLSRGLSLKESGYTLIPDPNDAIAFDGRFAQLLAYCKEKKFRVENDSLHFDPAVILDEKIHRSGYARSWFYCYNELQARLIQDHGDFG
jgi:broad specificity phosphatase PhoE